MNISARLARFAAAAAIASTTAFATADAAIIRFASDLGPEAAGATGSGSVQVEYDDVEHTLRILANWSGLSGPTTIAHIHCCVQPPGTVGVAVTPGTLPSFPAGVTAGSYVSPLIDLDLAASFTSTFLSTFGGGTVLGGRNALLDGMTNGTAYFNIHSGTFAGGEIRGFLTAAKVPEPGTLALLLPAIAGLLVLGRRRG